MPRGTRSAARKEVVPTPEQNVPGGVIPLKPNEFVKMPDVYERVSILERRVELLLKYVEYNVKRHPMDFERWLLQEQPGAKW